MGYAWPRWIQMVPMHQMTHRHVVNDVGGRGRGGRQRR